jgi:O-antigen/teichoic acid export membrane protein
VLASNTSAILIGRIASIGLGVTLATVLFKALGPQRYGAWSLLMLVAGYSTLIDFGLAAAIERRVANLWAQDAHRMIVSTVNSTVFVLILGVLLAEGIVIVVLVLPGVHIADENLRWALLVLPVCTGITLASLSVGAVLAGQQRMRPLHTCRTLGVALGTFAAIACVTLGCARLDVLLLAYTTGSVLALLMIWRTIKRTIPELSFSFEWDRDALHDLVCFGGVIQVATMVPPLAEYAFRLLVGARFGLASAGVYDLAARAAVVLRSLAGALFSAMVPFAIQTGRLDGMPGVARLTRTTARYVALFILPASAALLAFSGHLVRFWLGDAPLAEDVNRCFDILLVAHALGALAVPAAMVGRALGRPAAEAIATAVTFVTAVCATQLTSSLEIASGILWGLPAIGGFVVWSWLGRALHFRFVDVADLAIAGSIALATFAAAKLLEPSQTGAVEAFVRLAIVFTFALTAGAAAELRNPRWREALRDILTRPETP